MTCLQALSRRLASRPGSLPGRCGSRRVSKWYAQGLVSQEKAVEIAGLDRAEFLEELFRRKVPASQATFEELLEEIEHE